jgi:Family of unknown function (DUF6279)
LTSRAGRFLLVVTAALALAACSMTRVAYNNATPLAVYMVDDYFDLQDAQKDFVRERLEKAFAWHRESELPEYRKFLVEVMARTQGPFTTEDAAWADTSMRAFYYRALERLLPDMAEFIAQLDADQATRMARRFEEENAKLAKERLKGTPAERKERRTKRFVEYVEDWTGRLDASQRDLIVARHAAMADITDDWLADRRFRQSETLALVRAKLPREQIVAGLRRLLIESESWREPQYVAKLKQRDRVFIELVATLSATLSVEQRARMQKRVRGYLEDVTYLMAAG